MSLPFSTPVDWVFVLVTSSACQMLVVFGWVWRKFAGLEAFLRVECGPHLPPAEEAAAEVHCRLRTSNHAFRSFMNKGHMYELRCNSGAPP